MFSELLHLNLAYSESLRPGWGEWENPRSLTPARKSSFGRLADFKASGGYCLLPLKADCP